MNNTCSLALLSVVLLGCPREEVFDPSQYPPSPIKLSEAKSGRPEDRDVEIRLLGEGSKPREVLRYDIPAGFEGSIEIMMVITLEQPQEIRMPPVRIGMRLFDTKVDSAGIQYRFRFDEPVVEDDFRGIPADRVEEFRRDLFAIGRLEGSVSLDRRGAPRDVSFSGMEKRDGIDHFLKEIEKSVRNLSIPLPKQPVGVGASWEVLQTQSLNDLTFNQRTLLKLHEREGKRLVIVTETSQSAGRQQIAYPRLPPDAVLFVDRMRGVGRGVSYIDLSSLLPYRPTTSTSETSMSMEIQMQGTSQSAKMSMKIELTTRGVED